MFTRPEEELIEGPLQNPPRTGIVFNVIVSKLSQTTPGLKIVASLFGII